jgi:hypothetical protein
MMVVVVGALLSSWHGQSLLISREEDEFCVLYFVVLTHCQGSSCISRKQYRYKFWQKILWSDVLPRSSETL